MAGVFRKRWWIYRQKSRPLIYSKLVAVTGTIAATEGSDTAALNGDVIVKGALSVSESGADTAAFRQEVMTLTPADLAAIAAAVWADPVAVSAHAKLDAIIARITC